MRGKSTNNKGQISTYVLWAFCWENWHFPRFSYSYNQRLVAMMQKRAGLMRGGNCWPNLRTEPREVQKKWKRQNLICSRQFFSTYLQRIFHAEEGAQIFLSFCLALNGSGRGIRDSQGELNLLPFRINHTKKCYEIFVNISPHWLSNSWKKKVKAKYLNQPCLALSRPRKNMLCLAPLAWKVWVKINIIQKQQKNLLT